MIDLPTFLGLASAFNEHGVNYVLIGGLALFAQGLPRATKDVDFFIDATEDNVERLRTALREVYDDACINEIELRDLAPPNGGVVRYGPPEGDYVVDILGRLGEAWSYADLESQIVEIDGVPIRVATPQTLYRMKCNTVRLQDRADAQALAEKFDLEDG